MASSLNDLKSTLAREVSLVENSWPRMSPLQTLITINCRLNESANADAIQRQVNFMCYELAVQCENQAEDYVFEKLNEYFFGTKKFCVSEDALLLSEVLLTRKGRGSAVSLLYSHLAMCLGLNMGLVQMDGHTLMGWHHNGQYHYLDLRRAGQILTEEEILTLVNDHKGQMRILSTLEATAYYLSSLAEFYRKVENQQGLLHTLDMTLRIQPENLRCLAERGLLRKISGEHKEALCDLKRYFSFVDKKQVSTEILKAFEELKASSCYTHEV